MTDPVSISSSKAEGAMRTIGEVSAELGVKPHILRYWEAQFDMVKPLKRAGGRRYYRAEDVETLRTIDRLLNKEGFTVRGARQYLAGKVVKAPPAPAPVAAPAPDVPAIDLKALRAIRDRLAKALEAA
ncbi:DNA-binding transcriptional MerR regulator [Blastomonas natatoria]|uniref:DNA-binding transcriptional MerR regulator n=1 Tax=Blastomonas natatoria TaxID=34015 RepID=A0A2V3VDQ9_9SPHN|nr:MerR family transcriptional regulator [Blastomonas natatoria]PXW79314.1 DNA-binding transcriptional MerR regulator [Blastomonas natatoria]